MPKPEIELICRIPVFRGLAEEDCGRLAAVSKIERMEKGKTLFSEGDPSDVFYILVEGRVKIFKVTPDGRDIILGIFEPGEPLGAVAVYRAVDYPATAEILEESTLLAIPRRDLFQLLETYPTLTRGLLGALSLRLMELAGRLADLTGGRLEPRFARLFLKLADSMGEELKDGVFVPLHLSRQELADFTGTTIETTIRIMSRWGKDGLVVTEKEGFRIPDREELEALALT